MHHAVLVQSQYRIGWGKPEHLPTRSNLSSLDENLSESCATPKVSVKAQLGLPQLRDCRALKTVNSSHHLFYRSYSASPERPKVQVCISTEALSLRSPLPVASFRQQGKDSAPVIVLNQQNVLSNSPLFHLI